MFLLIDARGKFLKKIDMMKKIFTEYSSDDQNYYYLFDSELKQLKMNLKFKGFENLLNIQNEKVRFNVFADGILCYRKQDITRP